MMWAAIIVAAIIALLVAKALLSNSGPRVPPPAIADEDLPLVAKRDLEWYRNLSLGNAKKFQQQDNVYLMAAVLKNKNERGLSDDDAFMEAAKFFPIYYTDPSTRNATGQGDNAKLPFILKDRVNRSLLAIRSARLGEYSQSQTMNAVIRQLIRNGKM